MKKITIFSLHLWYGGVERCVISLANLLAKQYEVEIVSTYKIAPTTGFEVKDNVKITYLIEKYKPNPEEWKKAVKKFNLFKIIKESWQAMVVLFLKKFKTVKAMKECNSDIMISTRILFNKWLGKYGNKQAFKIGWEHNHHQDNTKYINDLLKSCVNLNALVLVSNSLYEFYNKKMVERGLKCKCVFIPNMLDEIPEKTSQLTEERIISIGRLSYEKGFSDLIDIFKKFHDKYPTWHLDLVGDGALKDEIQKKIDDYNLTAAVTMHGYLNKMEINKLLSKTSFYVMTSYTESFGIVLIEAMAYGIPCLAFTSAQGANDLISDNETGFLIQNRDVEQMVLKMEQLATDKNKRLALGNKARQFSLNYSRDIVKEKWLDLLEGKA